MAEFIQTMNSINTTNLSKPFRPGIMIVYKKSNLLISINHDQVSQNSVKDCGRITKGAIKLTFGVKQQKFGGRVKIIPNL